LPSTGTQHILVIPVSLTNYAANASEANLQQIRTTFFGASAETSWESLASYYSKSSFGQLTLTGKVTDWFDCGYSTDELVKKAEDEGVSDGYDPTWTVLEEAVAWYKKNNSDIADYDNNKDGILDGVWLVYSAPHCTEENGLSEDLFWAYTYWDYDALDLKPSASDPLAVNYCWASYDFASEGYGANGFDAHTYIHETGHLLGLDDYYVSKSLANTNNYGPMGGIDMMDYNIIDHDAYSKFAFGWEEPYVVSGGCEITLNPAASSGEAILLPTGDGWNGSAFDEYLLLEYYTPTGLNEKDATAAYPGNGIQGFEGNGIRIYHVDARMGKVNSAGFVAYTDTLVSDENYSTVTAHSNSNAYNVTNSDFRLIQELDCTKKRNFDTDGDDGYPISADDSSLFRSGNRFAFADYAHSFPLKTTMNDGTAFPYELQFGEQNAAGATVTITLA
jgi:M6 family metalloprotease-like protein